ncbi:MAG: 50S ribosomal protein L1 [uncultured bacterium]|nr:MAG: 50S ribosomal protein L1 [uncultured bacterium]HBC71280.1 50S ribosomal protein L1 [Coxiellaceae bacterium]HBS52178.1 50S ribosomal protein L1 [Coxiellaceae bacterium]HBY56108.1 50S ribosomal protein L1 [Coxiellaceae bacterium]
MSRITKRHKIVNEKITLGKKYSLVEALELLKSLPPLKFNESIDVSINLGVDTSKSDQTVRGAVVLPHGTGRKVRVGVFAQGDYAEAAKAAGAEVVGFDDLSEKIKQGIIDFDILIATPDAMRVVGQLGQILGPRGLMPNPKVGTVTTDVATAVKNAKGGQVSYRADKGGVVHCVIGKINFTTEALRDNLNVLLNDLKRVKPSSSKGIYIKKVSLSSTMGPGLDIDQSSIDAS